MLKLISIQSDKNKSWVKQIKKLLSHNFSKVNESETIRSTV